MTSPRATLFTEKGARLSVSSPNKQSQSDRYTNFGLRPQPKKRNYADCNASTSSDSSSENSSSSDDENLLPASGKRSENNSAKTPAPKIRIIKANNPLGVSASPAPRAPSPRPRHASDREGSNPASGNETTTAGLLISLSSPAITPSAQASPAIRIVASKGPVPTSASQSLADTAPAASAEVAEITLRLQQKQEAVLQSKERIKQKKACLAKRLEEEQKDGKELNVRWTKATEEREIYKADIAAMQTALRALSPLKKAKSTPPEQQVEELTPATWRLTS